MIELEPRSPMDEELLQDLERIVMDRQYLQTIFPVIRTVGRTTPSLMLLKELDFEDE